MRIERRRERFYLLAKLSIKEIVAAKRAHSRASFRRGTNASIF